MKMSIGFLALALSSSAFAKSIDLQCVTHAKDHSVRKFTISDLASASPSVSIYDAPFQEKTEDRGLVDISFSSECESSYRFVFSSYGVDDLKAGKTKTITGLFVYDNPTLSELVKGGDETASESVEVKCTVKN